MAEKRIVVVGLGLIGGSMAMALQGFEDYEVVGVVRSASTYQKAVERHAADRVTYDAAEELPGADVVILGCLSFAGMGAEISALSGVTVCEMTAPSMPPVPRAVSIMPATLLWSVLARAASPSVTETRMELRSSSR